MDFGNCSRNNFFYYCFTYCGRGGYQEKKKHEKEVRCIENHSKFSQTAMGLAKTI